jgi:hypothetical protein
VDGAKGGGQGKCGLAKHAPNTASGLRVTGAGPHTASLLYTACRQIPEVGAVCGKAARTGSVRGAHSNMRPYRDLHYPPLWIPQVYITVTDLYRTIAELL